MLVVPDRLLHAFKESIDSLLDSGASNLHVETAFVLPVVKEAEALAPSRHEKASASRQCWLERRLH